MTAEIIAGCAVHRSTNASKSGSTEETCNVNTMSSHQNEFIGKLLVFVNPNSGHGKGVQTFHDEVEPRLREKRIDFELIITNGTNHAKGIVEEREDLPHFNAILILSGDGLVFEILNGLMNRADHWQLLHVLPIALIPSGSGNGLLSSIFAHRGYPLRNPAFTRKAIELATSASCLAQPVNLIHAQTRDANYAAFLSIGWGLMADIDIESERWRRSLGSNRFVLGALIRCIKLRSYRGRLSFRPHTMPESRSFGAFPTYGRSAAEKMKLCTCAIGRRTAANKSTSTQSNRRNEDVWTTSHCIEGIPSVDEPISQDRNSGWTVIEDDFVGIYAMSLSHIANDGPMQPRAQLDDDRLYLSYIRKRDVPSRVNLMKMLSLLEQGKHLKMNFLKWVDVSSFRLEAIGPKKGRIVLDGEEMDTDIIQATVSTHRTAVIADV